MTGPRYSFARQRIPFRPSRTTRVPPRPWRVATRRLRNNCARVEQIKTLTRRIVYAIYSTRMPLPGTTASRLKYYDQPAPSCSYPAPTTVAFAVRTRVCAAGGCFLRNFQWATLNKNVSTKYNIINLCHPSSKRNVDEHESLHSS